MSTPLVTPSVKRRLASMIYEGMLLFGVLFISGYIFGTLLQQRHALYLREALQNWLFFVLGLYFIWFWLHGGQTLPMKTWKICLVDKNGRGIKFPRALARFLASWLWFVPGSALAWLIHTHTWMLILFPTLDSILLILFPALNFILWAMTPLFDKNRQFLHDRLAGTQLIVKV